MSAAPSTSFNPLKIALTATGVLAAATVTYAVYFDYRRRHDPVFRKNLLKESKKLDKKAKHAQEVGKEQVQAALKRAIALANAEKVPESAEGKEQFFMDQVALGEQLAARSPEFYVASAISFYKALKVYPAPQELIMIYQKTQPPAVFDLVMELISLEINQAASAAAARSSSAKRDDPLLQELAEGEKGENQAEKANGEDDDEEEIEIGSSSASASASTAQASDAANKGPSSVTSSTDSNTSPSSGSFVHVEQETDAVVDNEGEVVAEVTQAEVDVESLDDDAKKVDEETSASDPPEEPIAA
ncbi:hypothetical protein JCM10212_002274 [Sporobolomyces blumeae]